MFSIEWMRDTENLLRRVERSCISLERIRGHVFYEKEQGIMISLEF